MMMMMMMMMVNDESMKLMFAHSYRSKTVTSVLMKICSDKQFKLNWNKRNETITAT